MTLGVLLISFLVFLVAGDNQAFGPLDLDTANRLGVALWVAAPIAGGLAVPTPRIVVPDWVASTLRTVA